MAALSTSAARHVSIVLCHFSTYICVNVNVRVFCISDQSRPFMVMYFEVEHFEFHCGIIEKLCHLLDGTYLNSNAIELFECCGVDLTNTTYKELWTEELCCAIILVLIYY